MTSLERILTTPRYLAPAWIFTSLNIVVATWVLYVPAVKERLELDDGQLGLALFAFSAGLLTAIAPSSSLFEKFGLGRLSFIATCCFGLLMCIPVMATTYPMLVVGIFCTGLAASIMDIGMNALISELEYEDGVNIMSAAHGFFSLGGVIGAGLGSLLLGVFVEPVYHMLSVAAFLIVTNGFAVRHYLHRRSRKADRGGEGKFKFALIKPLLGFTVLAVLIMGSEGAIEHWSKLYLLDVVKISSDRVAGFGFVAFSATMTIGRFMGDNVSSRFGPYNIIIGGTLIAAAGFGLVLSTLFWPAMIGFALVGLGFSVIIPELFRLAGRAEGVSSAEGISVVAGMGYVGFLASPAILGLLSDWSSLRLSFAALLGAALVSALIAYVLKLRRT
ncbi:MFS transporter [Neolewinella antarctica]|uniref:Fucose permease n=1 Tax=Neolewinella antarctica TaxID=442734 RepID=A0ABX0X9A4_9BACT|nr:MFS transporter [Neolewinella antarctica]NJC25514.1 fucose permease [Neolewinella antarctica]